MNEKYRGKDIRGKWHYGKLSGSYIVKNDGDQVLVVKESIGRLCPISEDKGEPLYEGDVLLTKLKDGSIFKGTLLAENDWFISDGFKAVPLDIIESIKVLK